MRTTGPVEALLQSQRGLASMEQLQALGMSRAGLRWRLDDGWRRVLPRIVCARPDELDPVQRLITGGCTAATERWSARWPRPPGTG